MRLTNVQRKMLKVLADGLPHTREELHACLSDELGPLSNVAAHLTAIRKTLVNKKQTILCEWNRRRRLYRLVKLLKQAAILL